MKILYKLASSAWKCFVYQEGNVLICQMWHLSNSDNRVWLKTHKAMSFGLPLLKGQGLSLDTALYVSHCQVQFGPN